MFGEHAMTHLTGCQEIVKQKQGVLNQEQQEFEGEMSFLNEIFKKKSSRVYTD